MTEFIYYSIPLAIAIFLVIVPIFLFRIRTGVLILFAAGVSIQYLAKITFGSFNAFEVAGIGIPFLLICGLLISEKSIIYEFNKDFLIKYYCTLLILLFFLGVIFTGFLYPSHTTSTLVVRFTAWFKLLYPFIVLLVVSSLFTNEKNINRLLNCMLLSVVIPGSIFIWQIVTGKTVYSARVGYHFAEAFFHHPGVFAYYLLFCFPVCLFKYSQSRSRKEKYFWFSIILIFLILIFFTYRRGVWLGLFAQLFTYFFLFQKLKHKMIYGYIFILILIIISLSFTRLSSIFKDRFSDISTFYYNLPEAFETNKYDDLFSGRWRFFRANLLYLGRQPIINLIVGNGIGATYYASEQMGEEGGGHNIYLILLVDFGLIGFILYIFFLLAILSKLFRSLSSSNPFVTQYSRSLIALLFGYIVVGCVTHIFYRVTHNLVLWALVGALLGLLNNKVRSSQYY